ncbi:HNH endonuclease [Paenarthrobacter nicotinovorans]|uniref:HNH endonuclease n=1 Tax=Paenarthrobacter nicotinovorans TaxID=29320 RepID=A0ABV0GML4_PAENI
MGGHRPGLTLDHVCRNSLCIRPDHLMPMTQRRNSELGHKRAIEEPDAVLRDLLKIPQMALGTTAWAMVNRLPIGRAIPGGEPFLYGLDGQPFEHISGPTAYPVVTELLHP